VFAPRSNVGTGRKSDKRRRVPFPACQFDRRDIAGRCGRDFSGRPDGTIGSTGRPRTRRTAC
jgi:hypothetical protein